MDIRAGERRGNRLGIIRCAPPSGQLVSKQSDRGQGMAPACKGLTRIAAHALVAFVADEQPCFKALAVAAARASLDLPAAGVFAD